MTERPILFSAPMVRAILDGKKTQTRRVLQVFPAGSTDKITFARAEFADKSNTSQCGAFWGMRNGAPVGPPIACKYGRQGDRLWVRETHSLYATHGQNRNDGERWGPWGGLPQTISPDGTKICYYREGFDRCDPGRWRPSIHMPRWASRLLLEVTDVRVQRLQDISPADAIDEGVEFSLVDEEVVAVERFVELWDSINAARGFGWDVNPWVWAITFRRVEA